MHVNASTGSRRPQEEYEYNEAERALVRGLRKPGWIVLTRRWLGPHLCERTCPSGREAHPPGFSSEEQRLIKRTGLQWYRQVTDSGARRIFRLLLGGLSQKLSRGQCAQCLCESRGSFPGRVIVDRHKPERRSSDPPACPPARPPAPACFTGPPPRLGRQEHLHRWPSTRAVRRPYSRHGGWDTKSNSPAIT